MEAKAGYEAEKNAHKLNDIYAIKDRHERWMTTIRPLTAILERYERRAMRRYVKQMWIEPFVVLSEFTQLKKLFIANVPVTWDALWIPLLLDATPALESLHVHIDNSSEERSAGDLCDSLDAGARQDRYHRLKELVVAGFEGLGWQTGFVRLIMKRSPLPRRVHLLDGEVRVLQIVPRRREWHECERAEVLDDLTAGFRWPPQIILE
ncbi:uncharacterized protein C2845_PM02G45260 [Panicum miliaceum]|uniref:Uncharacterized protein n=1 Tax=Panicum miliaceum TaxID=4540 RepID=A0A3L6SAK9_PANMI|nr:uncharacterized protein C2845_PM02G45260 [Panicum miliaceum]